MIRLFLRDIDQLEVLGTRSHRISYARVLRASQGTALRLHFMYLSLQASQRYILMLNELVYWRAQVL